MAPFAGHLGGIMYAENQQEPPYSASVVYRGLLEINLNDGAQNGEGRCVILTRDGECAYAS